MRYGNPQPEAPTHLGRQQLPLPPEWLPAEEFEDDDEPPTRAAPRGADQWSAQFEISDSLTRQPTERSASPILLEHPREARQSERPHPEDIRKEAKRVRRSEPTVEGHRGSRSKSRSTPPAPSPSHDDERRSFAAAGEVDTSARDVRHVKPSRKEKPVERKEKPVERKEKLARGSEPALARGSKSTVEPVAFPAFLQLAAQGKIDPAVVQHEIAALVAAGIDPAALQAQVAAVLAGKAAPASAPSLDPAPLPVARVVSMPPLSPQPAARPTPQPGGIDPLNVAVPPELGGPIYSWVRRLALQADLAGADKVLREAFTDLTSSLSVAIVYPSEEGLFTLGTDDEIPRDQSALVSVAQSRQAVVTGHQAMVPVVTSTETVAVIVLERNPRNPAYHPIEQIAMVALARESAAILHHLAVAHLQRADEIKADSGGLYRGEALEAHRTRGNEGVPINLSPGWVKRAYPILVVTIIVAAVAAIFIKVPTYSTGPGAVWLEGSPVTAPAAGTVDKVFVKPGQSVKKGTPLVRLHSKEQDDELRAAQSDYDNATVQFLFDASDETVKKTLVAAITRVDREKARVESRTIRARADGTISDVRVRDGALLQPGELILQIVDPTAEPQVYAFLPGKDRPRLREGQTLQIEILGYTKTREKAIITHISPETLGPTEAAKIVGAQLADSVKLANGSYVWVRAKLPGKTFKTQHSTLFFHHGMTLKTEVKIQEKPFLVTLLPALERYLPD